MYSNCQKYWRSSLQTETALSTAEAEYIELPSALPEVLPFVTIMEEINEVSPLHIDNTNFVLKMHGNKQYGIKMATGTKFSTITNPIALK